MPLSGIKVHATPGRKSDKVKTDLYQVAMSV